MEPAKVLEFHPKEVDLNAELELNPYPFEGVILEPNPQLVKIITFVGRVCPRAMRALLSAFL